jgi:hypothetical protein
MSSVALAVLRLVRSLNLLVESAVGLADGVIRCFQGCEGADLAHGSNRKNRIRWSKPHNNCGIESAIANLLQKARQCDP